MSQQPWICERHGTKQREFCALCVAEFESRRPAAEMTVEERIAQLQAIPEQLTIPFSDLHLWITELMGRDVWTHELAYPEQLVEELRNGEHVGMADVLAKLPWDKPVLLVGDGNVEVLP